MLFLIQCLFHPPVVASVASKRSQSFCQMRRWQVTPTHAYTLDPTKSEWVDYVAVQAYCGYLSGNELKCNSSGNPWQQSSQLSKPLWTDPGLKSHCGLILAWCVWPNLHLKKKKKQVGNELLNTLSKFSHTRKKAPPLPNKQWKWVLNFLQNTGTQLSIRFFLLHKTHDKNW